MHACMYVRAYVCMNVCMYVCMSGCQDVCEYECEYECMDATQFTFCDPISFMMMAGLLFVRGISSP